MKTRIITAIVGILVLIGVLFTFDTLVFNFVIAAITLIAIHEVFKALGFGRKEWPMYAVFVPYTLLIMLSSYQVWRRLVMPASFLMVLFFGIYLVVRNAQVDFAKASGLVMFSGIVIFCFYSFIRLKELLPVETYGYDAMFFILLILCFAWGGDTCAYFAGRAFGKHKLCPVVSPKKTASISSRPLFIRVAESMVILAPMFQLGCLRASALVLPRSSSVFIPKNGPPDAVSRILVRLLALSLSCRHWKMAECSLSTGSSLTPCFATA